MNLADTGAKSLTTLAFERLRSDIVAGQLRPTSRLKVHGLSERYCIGTTAIREALSRLVAGGFVRSEEQRGFFVADVSHRDLLDLTRTRVQIESLALAQSFALGDVEWESAVMAAFHRLSRAPPPTSSDLDVPWEQSHRQFHQALVGACQSPALLHICADLYDKSERYRHLAQRHTSPDTRDTIAEHREIMEGALRRDFETVDRLMSRHFWTTTNIIVDAGFGA